MYFVNLLTVYLSAVNQATIDLPPMETLSVRQVDLYVVNLVQDYRNFADVNHTVNSYDLFAIELVTMDLVNFTAII